MWGNEVIHQRGPSLARDLNRIGESGKTAASFLAPILALAAACSAFALWGGALYTYGYVGTTEVDWGFVPGSVTNKDPPEPPTRDWNCDRGFANIRQVKEDVGFTTCALRDGGTLEVVLTNVYPGYYENVAFRVRNNGIVPLRIQAAFIDGREFTEPPHVELDLNGDGDADIEVRWCNYRWGRLDPGGEADLFLEILIREGAPEGAVLGFEVEVHAAAIVAPVAVPVVAPDFAIGLSPNYGSIVQGGSISTTVNVWQMGGFAERVSLSIRDLPSGAAASFDPTSGVPSFTSILTVSTSPETPVGIYMLTIEGSGGDRTRIATYTLAVTAPKRPADLRVVDFSVNPVKVEVGRPVWIIATVKNVGQGTGTRTLTLKINGVVERTSDITLVGGATGFLTFTVIKDVPGTYSVEVDGLNASFSVVSPPIGLALPLAVVAVLAIFAIFVAVYRKKVKGKRG